MNLREAYNKIKKGKKLPFPLNEIKGKTALFWTDEGFIKIEKRTNGLVIDTPKEIFTYNLAGEYNPLTFKISVQYIRRILGKESTAYSWGYFYCIFEEGELFIRVFDNGCFRAYLGDNKNCTKGRGVKDLVKVLKRYKKLQKYFEVYKVEEGENFALVASKDTLPNGKRAYRLIKKDKSDPLHFWYGGLVESVENFPLDNTENSWIDYHSAVYGHSEIKNCEIERSEVFDSILTNTFLRECKIDKSVMFACYVKESDIKGSTLDSLLIKNSKVNNTRLEGNYYITNKQINSSSEILGIVYKGRSLLVYLKDNTISLEGRSGTLQELQGFKPEYCKVLEDFVRNIKTLKNEKDEET